MFLLSQVKPSPIVNHSMPTLVATFSSPTFHLPDLTNWITHTFQAARHRAHRRAERGCRFALPVPVLTITIEALCVASAGPLVGTSLGFDVRSATGNEC